MGDPDRYTGLPESWSDSAKETYVQIDEEHGPLDAATGAAVFEICALAAHADACDAVVAEDGPMIPGSQGQRVAHPLLAESRQARNAALTALRALGLSRARGGASAAGAALVSRRWQGRR